MKNRKIVRLLENLTETEVKSLRKFVRSPAYNENLVLIHLLDYILRYHPAFDSRRFTQKQAYKISFEDSQYNERKLTKALSSLYKLTENFLRHHRMNIDPTRSSVDLLTFYNERALYDRFEQELKTARHLQDTNSKKNSNYYLNQFLIESEFTFYKLLNDNRKGDANLQNVTQSLDTFYFINKLMQACLKLIRQRVVNIQYEYPMLQPVLDFIKDSEFLYVPLIKIWYTALFLLREKDKSAYYYELKDLLSAHQKDLSTDITRLLYSFLESTLRNVVSDSRAYYEELFDLFKIQIDKNIFHVKGYLKSGIFNNVVTVALHLNKLDWIEKFLEENKEKIVPILRDDTYNYNLARLFFARKEFDQVLDIIQLVDNNDIDIQLGIKRLSLKTYIEKRESSLVDATINSFRVYIFRLKGLAPVHKKSNQNFINMAGRLFRLLMNPSPGMRTEKFRKEVIAYQFLPDKDWFIASIENPTNGIK